MSKWEKVIRGLEVCTSGFCSQECPYYQCDGLSCGDLLMRDTLALLKDQDSTMILDVSILDPLVVAMIREMVKTKFFYMKGNSNAE